MPRTKRREKKKGYSLYIAFGVAALIFIVVIIAISSVLGTPANTGQKVIVEIPQGSGLVAISAKLEEKGLIKNAKAFAAWVKVKGQAANLKAGEYEFTVGDTPIDILDTLVKGKVLLRQVTIPEGYTIYQVAKTLAGKDFGEEEKILSLLQSKSFANSLDVKADNLEGYLFPETYSYVKGDSVKTIVKRMVGQFFKIYRKEHKDKKLDRPMNMHQIVTLASICEEEARKQQELPLIARVYLNRLALGMPLQADPTVAYGLKKFDRPISRADWKRQSPYNTYLHRGLPPGPIASPGQNAIRAVFNPAQSAAIYFVAKPDGSHHFSKTYDEHLAAIRKYRR